MKQLELPNIYDHNNPIDNIFCKSVKSTSKFNYENLNKNQNELYKKENENISYNIAKTPNNSETNTANNSDDEEEGDEEIIPEDSENANFNVSNRLYFPAPKEKKNYLLPKVISNTLLMKSRKCSYKTDDLEFGVADSLLYKTKFPKSLTYERLCSDKPPYLAPIMVALIDQLDKTIPPIMHSMLGVSMDSVETADALFSTLLQFNVNDQIIENAQNIYLYNVPSNILTNTLQVFFQRLKMPLFIATREFCDIVTSNKYDIIYTHFGCIDLNKYNEMLGSLSRSLGISSNYQIANLAYFIERCQRWIKEDIKYKLLHSKLGKAEKFYADAAASLAILYGKHIVAVPESFVAFKIIDKSLPLVDDLRKTIFYFLLGVPPFEFWHLWSINTLCFEDKTNRCKCTRCAFLKPKHALKLETLPSL